MSKWFDQSWKAGTLVRVLRCLEKGDTKYLGTGKLKEDFNPCRIAQQKGIPDNSPVIEMNDGQIIYGYECWWIPESEVIGLNEYLEN
jgi:hypothetical protein